MVTTPLRILALASLGCLLWMTACDRTASKTTTGDGSADSVPQPTVDSPLVEVPAGQVPSGETPPVEDPTAIETPITVDDPDALLEADANGMALALSSDGVLIIDQQSGKTRKVPFSTDMETTQMAISNSLGNPTDTSENVECGAGPMAFVTWSNGFTANVMENQFVGWTVRPDTDSANLTTMDGVGLGSTLTELEENYDVGVIESSLGTEFSTFINGENGLFGLLDANEPDGVVTYLWSGIACNFR